jgi:hypothetical protein
VFSNSAANSLSAPAVRPKFRCPQFDENGLQLLISIDFSTMGGRVDGKKRIFPCRQGKSDRDPVMSKAGP